MNNDMPQEEALQMLQDRNEIAGFEKLNRAKRRQLDRMGSIAKPKKEIVHAGRVTRVS